MKFEFKSLFDLQSAFPDEQSCIDHLENMIWGDVIISPFDATSKVYKCKGNKYRCKNLLLCSFLPQGGLPWLFPHNTVYSASFNLPITSIHIRPL